MSIIFSTSMMSIMHLLKGRVISAVFDISGYLSISLQFIIKILYSLLKKVFFLLKIVLLNSFSNHAFMSISVYIIIIVKCTYLHTLSVIYHLSHMLLSSGTKPQIHFPPYIETAVSQEAYITICVYVFISEDTGPSIIYNVVPFYRVQYDGRP